MRNYNDKILLLLDKFECGEATVAELRELDIWYNSFQTNELYTDGYSTFEEQQVKEKLFAGIQTRLSRPVIGQVKTVKRLWPRIAIAAAAVIAITLGVWIFYESNLFGGRDLVSPLSSRVSRDLLNTIIPGKNTATLTLANGETITLSDAKTGVVVGTELRYNDNSAVNITATSVPLKHPSLAGGESLDTDNKVQNLSAATPRGGTYQITLPDGTRVWLNADRD